LGSSRGLGFRSRRVLAARASLKRTVDIDLVNRVLMQPHWQKVADLTDY
jgi:hypothetical protein